MVIGEWVLWCEGGGSGIFVGYEVCGLNEAKKSHRVKNNVVVSLKTIFQFFFLNIDLLGKN